MDAVRPVEYKAGAKIINEVLYFLGKGTNPISIDGKNPFKGEEGNVFFLLESGEAYATKTLEPGKAPQKVMDYNKGDYFGELALIMNTPRAANVISKVRIPFLKSIGQKPNRRIVYV